MVKVNVTNTEGETRQIEAKKGLSLMENIRDNDFDDLEAICGGCCSCCTCHVYVADGWYDKLPPQEEDEIDLVSDSENFKEGSSRLSCQIEVDDNLDGLAVTIVSEI